MEKIDIPFFYQLGCAIHPLTDTTFQSGTLVTAYIATMTAKNQLEALWPRIHLTVCRAAGQELKTALEAAENWLRSGPNDEPPKYGEALTGFDAYQAGVITAKATAFETVLTAELQSLPTYHATRKGIYSMPDLIDNAAEIFPTAMREKLGSEVIEEFNQSGRCLAFDNSTASGFHSMRAVESVMHAYYLATCHPKNKDKLPNWGAYLGELRKQTAKSPSPDIDRVISLLQQIKDHDRNLIMHPEITLSPDDALALFEIAQGAIMAMSDGLPKPRPPRARKTGETVAPVPVT